MALLKFRNERARLNHPQAGMITHLLWSNSELGFKYSLDEQLLPLFQANDMEEALNTINGLKQTNISKTQQWLSVTIRFPSITTDELQAIQTVLNLEDDKLILLAALVGHLDYLKAILEPKAPEQIKTMLEARDHVGDYSVFRRACQYGHQATAAWLYDKADDDTKLAMLKTRDHVGDYSAFRLACQYGHQATAAWLYDKADDDTKLAMLEAYDYLAFRWACANGHQATAAWLYDKADDDTKLAMLEAYNYYAFREVCAGGHQATVEWLYEKADDDTKLAMLEARDFFGDYSAFRLACQYGHQATAAWLYDKADDDTRLAMLEECDYLAFRLACEYGHQATAAWLYDKADDNTKLAMLEARDYSGNYSAFREACENGHQATAAWLYDKADDDTKLVMLKAPDNFGCYYSAFRLACKYGRQATVEWLLSLPDCLSYAEMHEQEYGEQYVRPFIETRLQALHTAENTYYHEHPGGVFDITDETKARQGFYILRNLIRRNDPALMEKINFLLDIPAIKALAHTEVTRNQSNELLRLAITKGNEPAIGRLLQIPAVRELALQNNFYADEMRGNLDLRTLAQDAESSMTALTPGEQKRLEKLRAHYQNEINELGQGNLFTVLKEELKERYLASPAKIEINGKELALPFQWQAFQELGLEGNTRQKALEAYCQHEAHSAYRYLSKPNLWMSSNASYVYTNDARTEGWSSFEEYKPLIVLLYCAAFDEDKKMKPREGHTLEGRKKHFINELAQIGRAHNWDKERHAKDRKTGELLYDEKSNPIMEEYDDLEGDKPSCFSGVKRRLFQSVIGHPLLSIFSKETLNQELREFLSEHFKQHISAANAESIQGALNALDELEDFTESQEKALAELDVPVDAQNNFIEAIESKYEEELRQEPNLKLWLKNEFKLKGGNTCHVFQFYILTNFKELLERKEKELNEAKKEDKGKAAEKPASIARHGLFAEEGEPHGQSAESEPGPSRGKVDL